MRALVSLSNPRSANAMFRAGNPPISLIKFIEDEASGNQNPRISLNVYFAFNTERYLQERGEMKFQIRKSINVIPSISDSEPIDFVTVANAEFLIRESESANGNVMFEQNIEPANSTGLSARRNHTLKRIVFTGTVSDPQGDSTSITSSIMRNAIIDHNVDPARMKLVGNFVDPEGNVTRTTGTANQSPLVYDVHYVDSGRQYNTETFIISGSIYDTREIRNITCSVSDFMQNVVYEFSYIDLDDVAEFLEIDISPYASKLLYDASITALPIVGQSNV